MGFGVRVGFYDLLSEAADAQPETRDPDLILRLNGLQAAAIVCYGIFWYIIVYYSVFQILAYIYIYIYIYIYCSQLDD